MTATHSDELFQSSVLTPVGGFTSGIEGPATAEDGTVYAVNYAREGTIGRVTPAGETDLFVELPAGSKGNGIRFNRAGAMFIADYTGHNILKVDTDTRSISVFAHQPSMNQPNDVAIADDDTLFASDPNWKEGTGQLWRIDRDGATTLLEAGMGTTNGIEVSPDNKTLYVNETRQRNVWAYDLAPDQSISNKRLLIQFEDHGMDGMRCDVDGNLFITRYGKGTIAIVSPAGELLREVQLHGKNCSNITFGGPDGCTCYVMLQDQGNIETFRTNRPGREWQLMHRV
ncbi:SMP-30/gluconolactonase/LRE family protein [Paenibacillus koleovorans]|uniref:SMP-30/gluconolactonase/LRE family protein n=1 Tax=Paenibacillus koleovorans TaxID=121608 RepID=UPI000FDA2972|nr:SMP-30/gluconolactonase/LRE family protein [Paenibacillus koleovorans]